ncbi:MAG: CDP-alcohol phosphatidyltransferase family protein [Flavobacteriales bacterium]|nr:CDP-alcohol phosphatidyltransferase family protein [Flavobacteriales bacterium]
MGNLFCGCLAVLSAFKGNLLWASYLIGVALILDFLDGFVARLLRVTSELGVQLDSLADVVTFGLAPGVIMFRMLEISRMRYFSSIYMDVSAFRDLDITNILLLTIPFVFTLCAAWRLARFNIDPEQRSYFKGLPSPAAAMAVASLPVILLKQIDVGYQALPYDETIITFHNMGHLSEFDSMLAMLLLNTRVLIVFGLIFSLWMIAPVRMLSLKFKHMEWKGNEARWMLLILSAGMLAGLGMLAVPLIMVVYMVFSILHFNIFARKKEEVKTITT